MSAEAEYQRQTHERIHNPIAQQYFDLLTNAGVVTYPLSHKVDLSLKQCIHDHADDLLPRLIKPNSPEPVLPRKQAWPRAVAARKERERQRNKRLAVESGVRLLFKDGEWLRYKRNASLSFGDIERIRVPVSIKSKRQRPNQCSPTRTGRYELTLEECAKIAKRIVNYLNRAIFGRRTRWKHHRPSITALIVVHSGASRPGSNASAAEIASSTRTSKSYISGTTSFCLVSTIKCLRDALGRSLRGMKMLTN